MTVESDHAVERSESTHTELQAIRRGNLLHVIEKFGGPNVVARMLGHRSGSVMSQMVSPNTRRTISSRRCREYEMVLALPEGYLDKPRKGVIAKRHSRRFWQSSEDATEPVHLRTGDRFGAG